MSHLCLLWWGWCVFSKLLLSRVSLSVLSWPFHFWFKLLSQNPSCYLFFFSCHTAVWVSLTCHNSYIVPPPLPILRLRLRLICYYGITKPFFSLPFPLLSPRLPFAHLLSPLQLIRTDLNIVLFVSHSHGADVSLAVCLWLYLGFEFLLSVHHLNSSLHIMLVRMYCGRDVVGSLDGVRGRPVGLDVFQ